MQAIACDTGPLQAVCKLSRKEHITQFAVTVSSERVPERLAGDQILLRVEKVEIQRPQMMKQGRHVDYTAVLRLLQTIQQQQGEQKVSQVIDTKCHAKTIFCFAAYNET